MNEYEELCYDLELAHRLSNFGCELAEEAIYWKDLASMYHIVEYTNDTTEEFRKAWQNEVKRCVQRIKEDFVVITGIVRGIYMFCFSSKSDRLTGTLFGLIVGIIMAPIAAKMMLRGLKPMIMKKLFGPQVGGEKFMKDENE